MRRLLVLAAILAALVGFSGAASAVSYSLTVETNTPIYTGAVTITVSGQVSPAPGPNTAVAVRVFNPTKVLVKAAEVSVNETTGHYSTTFVAGGSSSWVTGKYIVNATWGAYGPVLFETVPFYWSSAVTTSSTTTTSSSTTVSTSSFTPSTMTSTTSSATSSATSSQSSSSTSSSFSTATSATSATSNTPTITGSGIPEFPYQAFAMLALTLMVVASYLLVRRQTKRLTTSRMS